MKTPIAITLIIVGGLLVAAPIVSDYFQRGQIAEAMSRPGITSVTLGPFLSEEYRFGCWMTGGVMIASTIFFSFRNEKRAG